MSEPEDQDLELFHDETLGTGSYGKVCKAKFCELPCAAKILHPVLFQFNDPHSQKLLQRFEQECELLKMVRHPNVAQYLGVAHDPVSHLPVLLMELLDESLSHFLERSDEPLPYHLQLSLWYDIALALAFLHSKGIIHRDLSGNNVLLIAGSRAKVTDFGMSKLTLINARMSRLTQCPGTPFYMSPEALRQPPVYTKRLDVFSSGVVAVQIITREYPDPGDSMKERDDPNSPSGVSFTPIAEVERRRNHIDLIDLKHPMLPAIKQCLSDKEKNRPSARELCQQLASLKQAPEFLESMRQPTPKEQRIEAQVQEIQQLQRQNRNQKQEHQRVIDQIRTEQQCTVQQFQAQITKLENEKVVLNTQIGENQRQLRIKERELWTTHRDLQQKTRELQLKQEELQKQDGELQKALQGQLLQESQCKVKELESKVGELEKKGYLVEQLPPGTLPACIYHFKWMPVYKMYMVKLEVPSTLQLGEVLFIFIS